MRNFSCCLERCYRVLLPLSLSLSFCIYCISGLSATWSSLCYCLPGDHVTQTTTPPLSFYISLTHSLTLFLCVSFPPPRPPCNTHCTLSLSLLLSATPTVAFSLSLSFSLSVFLLLLMQSSPLSLSVVLSTPQLLSHPIWQASGLPPLSPPSTAEHPLEHG